MAEPFQNIDVGVLLQGRENTVFPHLDRVAGSHRSEQKDDVRPVGEILVYLLELLDTELSLVGKNLAELMLERRPTVTTGIPAS